MTRAEQLEQEVLLLNPDDFGQLRDWLMDVDGAEWDRQIAQDWTDGKLDRLVLQALADHAAGKSQSF